MSKRICTEAEMYVLCLSLENYIDVLERRINKERNEAIKEIVRSELRCTTALYDSIKTKQLEF